MLCDDARLMIELFVKEWNQRGELAEEIRQGNGPRQMIDDLSLADVAGPRSLAATKSILANKTEAAQYLAGLLGLC